MARTQLKAGDKVKVLETDYPEIPVGTTTTVVEPTIGGANLWCEEVPEGVYFYHREFELLPVAAATGTAFKVGDRVRVTDPSLLRDGTPIGALGTIKYVLTGGGVDFDLEHPTDGVIEQVITLPHEHLELVDSDQWDYDPRTAAKPLTIQAGKFYKTRDGRKVGPMRRDDDAWSTGAPWIGRLWRDNGIRYFNDEPATDLIAEWVEPATAPTKGCAAAEVDNIRDEYGPFSELIGKPFTVKVVKAEPKFKVGDRVRLVRDQDTKGRGCVGKVESIWGSGSGAEVEFDAPFEGWGPRGRRWNCEFANLELVTDATTPAIVALIENGQPKPSTYPHVHGSRAAAEKEAARLAGKFRGKEFGVYELVSSARKEPEYAHEWQRLAAGGQKIAAIKAYREAGGRRKVFVAAERGWPARFEDRHVIGLKEAKDAVEHWLRNDEPWSRLAA